MIVVNYIGSLLDFRSGLNAERSHVYVPEVKKHPAIMNCLLQLLDK
jgi:hypothetical protein